MARGWESKAIEDQQLASENRRRTRTTAADASTLVPTPERAALLLARTRALGDLQLACAPAHGTWTIAGRNGWPLLFGQLSFIVRTNPLSNTFLMQTHIFFRPRPF